MSQAEQDELRGRAMRLALDAEKELTALRAKAKKWGDAFRVVSERLYETGGRAFRTDEVMSFEEACATITDPTEINKLISEIQSKEQKAQQLRAEANSWTR